MSPELRIMGRVGERARVNEPAPLIRPLDKQETNPNG